MKRRNEDELIKLAFGDCDPNRSQHAQRLVDEDPQAAKLFASYAELRESLRSLEAPEHQLSNERLRARILEGGLKKAPSAGLSWRWGLAPLAVAAAALVVTLRLAGPSIPKGTYVSGNPDLASNVGSADFQLDWSPTGARAGDIRWNDVLPAAERIPSAVRNPSGVASVSGRRASSVLASAPNPAARKNNGGGMSPQELSSLALDGALPAGAIALNADLADGDPIVLIGADSDESTGVNRATEVSSPSNVVVGG